MSDADMSDTVMSSDRSRWDSGLDFDSDTELDMYSGASYPDSLLIKVFDLVLRIR